MAPQPPRPPLSSATLRWLWRAWKFNKSKGKYVHIAGHSRLVADAAFDAWKTFGIILDKHNYVVQKLSVWVNRYIGGTTVPSAHGYGTAADVNYYLNGKNGFNYGWSWSKTDFTPELVDALLALRTNNNKQVFAWGGTWRTKQDYMHWYIACGPKDLANGIDYETVGVTPIETEVNMIKLGDRGVQVRQVQESLIAKGFKLPKWGVDGDFGNETLTAVQNFQNTVGLVSTGIVDGVTAAFLLGGGGTGGVGAIGPTGPRGPMGSTPDLSDYVLVPA